MPGDAGPEQVSCSFDELKTGKKFTAGHEVVLIVSDLVGTPRRTGNKDGAAAADGDSGGKASDAEAKDGDTGAKAGGGSGATEKADAAEPGADAKGDARTDAP